VVAILKTAWIGTGPRVKEFESTFARYTGAKHAIAVSSCTAALHLAMAASGVGPGDEVITTSMTFCATANAIVHTGATPVLVDCRRDTMNIDPAAVEAAVTPKTKAIVPVHFAGRPVDLDPLREIAKRRGLLVIEDAAHAIESTYKGRKIGSISDATCFSFYVTKNMTTGEGGMVTTDNDGLAAQLRTYALHGMSADAWSRFSDKGFKHYEVVQAGFKYNLTDMAASLGLAQMPKLEPWLARRNEVWRRYDRSFEGLPAERPAPADPESLHSRHLYTLLVGEGAPVDRDGFLGKMHERKIGTGVHYRAVHNHPYYRDRWGYEPMRCPNALDIGNRTVSLPLSAKLSDDEVDRVIAATREVLGAK
jgi:dTDP-4-amino-4,6-dideoxygalactose transaminase